MIYSAEDAEKLKRLGFVFETVEHEHRIPKRFKRFRIKSYPTIEINSVDELVALSEEYGEIIVDGKRLIIYDDYRE